MIKILEGLQAALQEFVDIAHMHSRDSEEDVFQDAADALADAIDVMRKTSIYGK